MCSHAQTYVSLFVSSAHQKARRQRGSASESPSRWKSQSKGSAVPKKHHIAPLLTFWSQPRGGREPAHFLNRIKTWRQAAPHLVARCRLHFGLKWSFKWDMMIFGLLFFIFFIWLLNKSQKSPNITETSDGSRGGGVKTQLVRSYKPKTRQICTRMELRKWKCYT